jgi:hypothetical protein
LKTSQELPTVTERGEVEARPTGPNGERPRCTRCRAPTRHFLN